MELEWVEFEPREGQRIAFFERYNKMGQLRAWARAQAASQALAKGNSFEAFAHTLEELGEALAELVADWDLRNEQGKALPKPTRGEAFYDLTTGETGEIAWVLSALAERFAPDPES